jgi:uncharacterized alpha/beta hydrolase family protein
MSYITRRATRATAHSSIKRATDVDRRPQTANADEKRQQIPTEGIHGYCGTNSRRRTQVNPSHR